MISADVVDRLLESRVDALLRERRRLSPGQCYLRFEGDEYTFEQVGSLVDSVVAEFRRVGIDSGDRVAVAMPNHPLHVAVILSILQVGAIWIPVNPKLRGAGLDHIFDDAHPSWLLVDATHRDALKGVRWLRTSRPVDSTLETVHGVSLWAAGPEVSSVQHLGDIAAVLYTSGTTGPAKGALLTERMLRASALGVLATTQTCDGDVMLVWEPLYHMGGVQEVFVPMVADVTLALQEGFSVRAFWDRIARDEVTHFHYLGGVAQMLLNAGPTSRESSTRLRVMWGAGLTGDAWSQIRRRFGVAVHECYGMTEASSISTINLDDEDGGMGWEVPWFEVALGGETSADAPEAEVLLRGRLPGLITDGYLNRPVETQQAWTDGWWHTGDAATRGERGQLHFGGRVSDSIRHRGENVSAWQVESVFGAHPDVEMVAMVGVPDELGEHDIKLYVVPTDGSIVDPADLLGWAESRLSTFQLPRYIAVVNDLPLTPTRRVAKGELDRSPAGAYDRMST